MQVPYPTSQLGKPKLVGVNKLIQGLELRNRGVWIQAIPCVLPHVLRPVLFTSFSPGLSRAPDVSFVCLLGIKRSLSYSLGEDPRTSNGGSHWGSA